MVKDFEVQATKVLESLDDIFFEMVTEQVSEALLRKKGPEITQAKRKLNWIYRHSEKTERNERLYRAYFSQLDELSKQVHLVWQFPTNYIQIKLLQEQISSDVSAEDYESATLKKRRLDKLLSEDKV